MSMESAKGMFIDIEFNMTERASAFRVHGPAAPFYGRVHLKGQGTGKHEYWREVEHDAA